MESGMIFEIGCSDGFEVLPPEIRTCRILGQFPLPTEFVVSKVGEPTIPLMGRIYDIAGESHLQMVAVEVWLDNGDDGHIDQRLTGVIILDRAEVLVANSESFMKTSAWLYDMTLEAYNKHYYKKWDEKVAQKCKEAK